MHTKKSRGPVLRPAGPRARGRPGAGMRVRRVLGGLQEALWRLRSSEDHPGSFKSKANEEFVMIFMNPKKSQGPVLRATVLRARGRSGKRGFPLQARGKRGFPLQNEGKRGFPLQNEDFHFRRGENAKMNP